VRAFAREQRLSLEHAARRCRYRFLRETALAAGLDLVAVGHTATDQAETVLLRILRGTGVSGLAAMAWRSSWPDAGDGPTLLRPMLGLRREDTRAYCEALGLAPRHDPENDSPHYLRNRVRADVLPALAQLNPRIVDALTGLAASARDVRTLVEAAVDAQWAEVATHGWRTVTFDRRMLTAMPAAVRAEALRRAVAELSAEALPPERTHTDALERLLDGPAGGSITLAGGVRAQLCGGQFVVAGAGSGDDDSPMRRGPAPLRTSHGSRIVARMGTTHVPGWGVTAADEPRPSGGDHGRCVAWLRPQVFDQPVVVTGRMPGDRIQPSGMTGHKRVNDLLVDAGVPPNQRDAVPILRSGERIAWVVGIRLAAWAAAAVGEPAIRVTFIPSTYDAR
jgi:tRNA(Ile)-lysidine synthase